VLSDSAPITSKVAEFFQAHDVSVLNLGPLLEGRDPGSMIVNSMDAHPNEVLSKEIGELLTHHIQSEELTNSE
jgi:hypothetical protein